MKEQRKGGMNKFNAHFYFLVFALIITPSLVSLSPVKVKADVKIPSTNITDGAFKRTAYFEKNIGQANSDVLYLYPTARYKLMLSSNGAEIFIQTPRLKQPHIDKPALFKKINQHKGSGIETCIKMQFLGANKSPLIKGKGELRGKSHYFIGKDQETWLRNVPHYDNVVYEDIYPAVDLIFYSNETNLEYDFIIKPEADLNNIRFTFRGIDRMSVDSEGDLVLFFGEEELRLHRPKIYQLIDGHKVDIIGDYIIHDDIVGVQVTTYDHSVPLVIDPVLSYATYIGDTGVNEGSKIAVDADKNVYVVGYTDAINGTRDIFLVKFDSAGQLVYLTYLGGEYNEIGNGISVDASKNVYLAGTTGSSDFPTTPGVIQPSCLSSLEYGCGDSAFVVKINSTGSDLLYSTYLSGGPQGTVATSATEGNGIAVDPSGNVYIAGYTCSPTFPVTPGAFQTTYGGAGDVFVSKLNDNATQLVYATYLGGFGIDRANAIAIDADGNAYVAGKTASPTTAGGNDFPLKNAFQNTQKYLSDGFVSKVNPTGSALVFSTFLGGSSDVDQILGLAVDNQRNIFVTGQTKSADWPGAPNQGAWIETFGAGFVTKLRPAGDAIVYSFYLGYYGYGSDIATDALGNAYVIGTTSSPDFPVTADAYQIHPSDYDDFFISKIDSNGLILYSTFLGGSNYDRGNGIAVGSPTEIYVTGGTASKDFPIANAVQPQNNGLYDAIIAKIDIAAPVYKLSIVKIGDDTDNIFRIISDPPGIKCGHAYDFCEYNFDAGTQVTLSVDPSLFPVDWNYAFSGTDETNKVTMSQERNVTVTFNRLYGLYVNISGNGKVTSNPAGIDCKHNCSYAYPSETIVTLTATPDVNYTFGGWGGEGCSGTGACMVTMNQTRNVYATFSLLAPINDYTLIVTKSGTGNGTITSSSKGINCGSVCNETFAKDAKAKKVSLKVKPDSNSTFLGWGGDCQATGTKTLCKLTMDSDKNVSASFGLPDISVSPTSYNFSNVTVKQLSSPATFTIQNNGTGNLKITKLKVIGTDAKMFKIKGGGKKTILSGETYSFTVTFKPSSAGTKSATLQILSNDPDSQTIEIPLAGTGN
jgi:hypothetical protein